MCWTFGALWVLLPRDRGNISRQGRKQVTGIAPLKVIPCPLLLLCLPANKRRTALVWCSCLQVLPPHGPESEQPGTMDRNPGPRPTFTSSTLYTLTHFLEMAFQILAPLCILLNHRTVTVLASILNKRLSSNFQECPISCFHFIGFFKDWVLLLGPGLAFHFHNGVIRSMGIFFLSICFFFLLRQSFSV